MCLAVPAQLKTVSPDGLSAVADSGGIEKPVDVSFITEPKPGDWVIVHVGFALNKIDEQAAAQSLALLEKTAAAGRADAAEAAR